MRLGLGSQGGTRWVRGSLSRVAVQGVCVHCRSPGRRGLVAPTVSLSTPWASRLPPVLFLLLVCVYGLRLSTAGVWVVFLSTYLPLIKKINRL